MEAKYAYDQVAKAYDTAFTSSVSKAEDQLIYKLVKSILVDEVVLDLGCGTGALLEHVKIKPENYIGIDFSQEMLDKAKKKFPFHLFINLDIRKLPFDDGTVDNVISLFCACSYAGSEAIDEALRVLSSGGSYFFMIYSSRYRERKSYILNKFNLNITYDDPCKLLKHFPKNAKVLPFNYSGDSLGFIRSSRVVAKLLTLETLIYGWSKEPFLYIVMGNKP